MMSVRWRAWHPRLSAGERGQSLLETAILTPLLLWIAFNAINFSYFWYMVLTLSSAPRHGAQFATQGGVALSTTNVPETDAIKDVVYENLLHTVGGTTSNASVRVCASSKGVTSNIAQCDSYGPTPNSAFLGPSADPEAPLFVLHRVDVEFRVTPLIPGSAFGVIIPSNLYFQRQVSMRSLY
jgi:Flp pilus assembly protein TadG